MVLAVAPADVETRRWKQCAQSRRHPIRESARIEDWRKGSDLMLKLAVLVSGGGTNLQAIMDAIDAMERSPMQRWKSRDQQQQGCVRPQRRAENQGNPGSDAFLRRTTRTEENAFNKALLAELQMTANQVDLDSACRISGCAVPKQMIEEAYPKPDHQYPSVPDPVFLRNRILRTASP